MEEKRGATPQAKREEYPLPWWDRTCFILAFIFFGIFGGYKTWWSTLILLGTLFFVYLMIKKCVREEVLEFGRERVYGKPHLPADIQTPDSG